MAYTLNPYIESTELVMLYKKPETLGFYASPKYPLANKNNIDAVFLIVLTKIKIIQNL